MSRTLTHCFRIALLVGALGAWFAPSAWASFSITATPGNGQVKLDWPDVATADFYDVYRDGQWVQYVHGPTSTWTNTGVTNNTTYRYQVRAYEYTGGGGSALVDISAYADSTPGKGFGCFDFTTLTAGARPPACWRPFADSSPFNRRIPASPTLAGNSANIVAYMTAQNPSKLASNTGGYDWSHATYFAKSTDPSYTIHCTENWGTCEPEGLSYKIPAQAKPAGWLSSDPGMDRHLSVVQPNGTTLDLWQADTPSGSGGTLDASWGGVSDVADDGLGSNANAGHYGGIAGQIRAEELAAGSINHALFAITPCTNGKVFPAGGFAHQCGAANAPPNGSRLQLNMTEAEINALAVPAWKKTILHALRTHGMIVGDTGGGSDGFGLQFESGAVYRSFGAAEAIDTWAIANSVPSWYDSGIGRTLHIFDLAPGVSWSTKLRVIAPCISDGTC